MTRSLASRSFRRLSQAARFSLPAGSCSGLLALHQARPELDDGPDRTSSPNHALQMLGLSLADADAIVLAGVTEAKK